MSSAGSLRSPEDSWRQRKRYFLERLERERAIGRVDEDIVDLLYLINSFEEYYTTSSCSGRIQVAEVDVPWDKWNFTVLGKWHRPVSLREVLEAVRRGRRNVWFMVHPPIMHVMARDLDAARRLLMIARESGFKHSGIQGIREDRVIVEILSFDKMEFPLILRGRWVVREAELPLLVGMANTILLKCKERLKRLERNLRLLKEGGST